MSRLEVSAIKVFIKKYSVELKTYGNFWTKIIKGISKASLEFPCVRPKTDTELISTGLCIRRSTVVPLFGLTWKNTQSLNKECFKQTFSIYKMLHYTVHLNLFCFRGKIFANSTVQKLFINTTSNSLYYDRQYGTTIRGQILSIFKLVLNPWGFQWTHLLVNTRIQPNKESIQIVICC